MVAQTTVFGYKKTELGVIPEDWQVKQLGEIGRISGRVGWKGYTKGDLKESGPYTIGAKHINENNKLDLSDPTCLSVEKFLESPEIVVRKEDILIVQRGTIGKLALIDDEIGEATINPSMVILRIRDASPSFVYYVLTSSIGQKQILLDTSSTGVPMITQKQVGTFKVPFPPKPEEQSEIAAVLSDTDDLIESFEKLVAKKKNIKQGAMQELLTGKRKLPEFSDTWETKEIGEFADLTAGGTPSTFVPEYWNGNIKWMNSGELNLKRIHNVEGRITQLGLENSSTRLLPPKCVLIGLAGQGKTRGTVAMNYVELCTNQSIGAVLPNDSFVPEYLYHNLDFRYHELRRLSTGEGGRGGLNLTILRNMMVALPPTKEEQSAIAHVLDDMDLEIEGLELKRDKYKQLKMGMMQQLLTGRIRLKWNS